MKPILALALAMVAVPAVAQQVPQSMPATTASPAPDPVGGYAPPPSPPAPPGAVFQPGPTPDQAFPHPPPLANYPFCKRGQFDKCRQRNDPK